MQKYDLSVAIETRYMESGSVREQSTVTSCNQVVVFSAEEAYKKLVEFGKSFVEDQKIGSVVQAVMAELYPLAVEILEESIEEDVAENGYSMRRLYVGSNWKKVGAKDYSVDIRYRLERVDCD